jgi:murein DD-endopeptidase MepM/ murein hydrolase activator NlpD
MAILSPIFKILSQSQKNLSSNRDEMRNINRTLSDRQKFKRDYYAQTNFLRGKREEDERRQQLEDELEAPTVVTKSSGPAQLVQKSTSRGWFDRILGFIGYLSAGWIMNNLPTWIGMGKEFLARIKVAGEITSGFFNDTVKIFTGFGNLLSAAGENLLRFDFLDTSNRIKNALGELNSTVGDMGSKLEQALGLVTTEGKYSGQEIPKLGTEQKDKGAYTEPAPYNAGDGGAPYTGPKSSGGVLNPQEGYAYLRQLGVSHAHALGILANIGGESDFRIGVDEETGGGGVGLFQYTEAGRKRAFLKAVPDYRTNWKGQIKFAIGESVAPTYLKTQFSSPEEAAYWWMRNWEIPDSRVYTKRNAKHNAFIRSFKPSSSTSQQSPSSQQSQIPQVAPGKVNPIISSRYGVLRKNGRRHGGTDLATNEGTALRSISDGSIIDSDYDDGGWGNFLVMKDNLGIYHLYGHMQSGYKRSGSVKKGEVIGKVGTTGRTTGPHLHWEAGTGWNGSVLTGKFDPLNKYSKYAPFNTDPGPGFEATTSIPAQISPSSTQQRAGVAPGITPDRRPQAQISPASTQQRAGVAPAITPDRRPQDIIVYQPPNQQKVISSSGGGDSGAPSSTPISNTDLLNNFIRNKLLLDLAYL